jgi:Ala-tRNA(Pro) deacylase
MSASPPTSPSGPDCSQTGTPTDPTETPPDYEAQLPSKDSREEALYARFRALGIAWSTHAHAPVFTVEEAQNLRGTLPGMHTKNLFLKDKSGGLWLVVAREELRIDLNALSKALGAPRFSFGKPELMVEVLGIAPGAVTPFALMNDRVNAGAARVSAVFDKGILEAAILNFHPLRNDKTTAISPSDLLKFAADTGHIPRLLDLPEREG